MHCETIHSDLPPAEVVAAAKSMHAAAEAAASSSADNSISLGKDQKQRSGCKRSREQAHGGGVEFADEGAQAVKRASLGGVHAAGGNSLPLLLTAARDGDMQLLQSYVAEHGAPALLCVKDKHGSGAVHWAAGSGQVEVLRFIASLADAKHALTDASGKAARRRDGRQPLHWAARNNQSAALLYLLASDSNVEPDARTYDGTTPLMLAAYGGALECCIILHERGATLTAVNNWDCNIAHWAAMGGSLPVLQWLMEAAKRCSDADSKDSAALTAGEAAAVAAEVATTSKFTANTKMKLTYPASAATATAEEAEAVEGSSSAAKVESATAAAADVSNSSSDTGAEIRTDASKPRAHHAPAVALFSALQKEGHSVLHKCAQRQHRAAFEWLQRELRRFGEGVYAACCGPDSMGYTPQQIFNSIGRKS